MDCPKGHGRLKRVTFGSIPVDRCAECGGSWYDSDELRLLKDREAHGDYCWIDFDLWKEIGKFRAARQQRYNCPRDGGPLTTVRYGDSSVTVDICSRCKGIWLDKDEYDEIVAYLEETVDSHTVSDYLNDLREEFLEVLNGPESLASEVRDLSRVLYLLQLRFVIEHSTFGTLINSLPRY
jgi:Zn-finger nucleic acid-binding protein